jgi:hypothetical protein
MDEETAAEIASQLKLISSALGILCVTSEPIASQSLGVQSRLLKSIGFKNAQIVELLGSTPNSIRVRLAETKTWRSKSTKANQD